MTLTSNIGNIIINLPWLKTTLAPAGLEPPTSQYGLDALQPETGKVKVLVHWDFD